MEISLPMHTSELLFTGSRSMGGYFFVDSALNMLQIFRSNSAMGS